MAYPHYESFTEFIEKYVIPRKYALDERLDQRDSYGNSVPGRAPKGNPIPAATFRHDNKFWDVHLDTYVRPICIAYKEMTQKNTAPFRHEHSASKRKDGRHGVCLVLREDIWPPKKGPGKDRKLMYIYQVQDRGVHIHVFE